MIRPARADDLEAIARVQAEAVVASSYYDDSVDVEAEVRRRLPRIRGYFHGTYHPSYALPERAVFVAEASREIVGFIAGQRSTRMGCNGELQWIFVRPSHQRQGLGGQLLQPLAEWLTEQESTRVIIDAPPENPYRAFYLRWGAIPLDGYWLYWRDIGRDVEEAAGTG